MAKTNIELATLFMASIAPIIGDFPTYLVRMMDACTDVLATVDMPDGEPLSIGETKYDALCPCRKGEMVSMGVIPTRLVDDVRNIEGLKDELGNMGVALGMVEGQRDDAVVALESVELAMSGWVTDGNLIDEPSLRCEPLKIAREAIAKCKAGVTKPPTQASYEEVDDCTIKLWFTEPEDLQKFVASYQPKVKS